ncbi:MAG: exosortase E/protease, VPEID-CTERM system [Acidobacteriia bacterium]|nr:exosortase E/protease, VPEID-CTERM system [Terriglobia bacterium]
MLAVGLCGSAFVPPRVAWRLVRSTGHTWIFALTIAVIARLLMVGILLGAPALGFASKAATDLTFAVVNVLLRLILPRVITDWTTMTIGSPEFNVTILPWCAGFEGTALMLVFSVAWLGYFRKEFRFPNALVLVPAGMAVMWLSNAARIVALILIGVAGAPNIAVGGFHSQAGWIAFNCVALGFVLISRRLPWVTVEGVRHPAKEVSRHNPTSAYLLPFLVIVAAGMISSAASGGFEWLYPLRFLAAAIALWFFRSTYSSLNWKFGWYAVLTGIAVLAMWLGLDRFSGVHADNGIGAGLAALPGAARIAWLVLRTAAAVITVPIAEELVFRGFLIRRLISSDFESLDPRRYTYVSVLISSVAFGVLHGDRWLAGTLAGLLYAIAYLRRGRIGDAVIAHATTNALLAAWVLIGGRWYLW